MPSVQIKIDLITGFASVKLTLNQKSKSPP